MTHVYDALATITLILGCVILLLLAWRSFAVIAWFERRFALRRPGPNPDLRRTTILDGRRRLTLTSEGFDDQGRAA